MSVLCVDIGLGTNDLLLWDSHARGENQTHMVVPSTTTWVAAEIADATRRGLGVVFRGALMGGGPSARAMRRHLEAGLDFWSEPQAARTFSDDLDEVAEMGVTLVSDDEAAGLLSRDDVVAVRSGDLRLSALEAALDLLGAGRPTGLAIAVQDHGHAPRGMSDRVFRFRRLEAALSRSRRLVDLFYRADDIPASFTRMKAVAESVGSRHPLVVGDTGPSALWGAYLAVGETRSVAINYGNGHTLMSLLDDGRLDGLFEHHTGLLDASSMSSYLRRFSEARLSGDEVFRDGGHGALQVSRPFRLDEVPVSVTGPKRELFHGADFRQRPASIHGDMMVTGCWGLLRAYRSLVGQVDPED